MNEVNNEVSNLKYIVNEQQSQAATAAKHAVETAAINMNSNIGNNHTSIHSSTGNRHSEEDIQTQFQGVEDVNNIPQSQEKALRFPQSQESYSTNDEKVMEKEKMEKEKVGQEEEKNSSEALKRKRQEEWEIIQTPRAQQKRVREDSTISSDYSPPTMEYNQTAKESSSSGNEPTISSSRPRDSICKENSVKQEEIDTDDDRCQICLDCPYGLMVLCSICKRALHSACAKKTAIAGNTGYNFYRISIERYYTFKFY